MISACVFLFIACGTEMVGIESTSVRETRGRLIPASFEDLLQDRVDDCNEMVDAASVPPQYLQL